MYLTVTNTIQQQLYGGVTNTIQQRLYGSVTNTIHWQLYGGVINTIQWELYCGVMLQACAYKMGLLEIQRLRQKAVEKLGRPTLSALSQV